MYAVIHTGGKQHRVKKGEHLKVEKLNGDVGAELNFDEVLLIAGNDTPQIGQPFIEGASVSAKIIDQNRYKKVIVFKKQRRLGFHKKIGHRQSYTELEITGIRGA